MLVGTYCFPLRFIKKCDELFELNVMNKELNKSNGTDYFYDLMLTSCRDAVRIQNELGGLMDAKSLAVTLFIARSKINGNSIQ